MQVELAASLVICKMVLGLDAPYILSRQTIFERLLSLTDQGIRINGFDIRASPQGFYSQELNRFFGRLILTGNVTEGKRDTIIIQSGDQFLFSNSILKNLILNPTLHEPIARASVSLRISREELLDILFNGLNHRSRIQNIAETVSLASPA